MQRLQKPQEGPQIFDDDVPSTPAPAGSEYQQPKKRSTIPRTRAGGSLDPEHLNRALVPDPLNNARWHRKMVIRAVRRGTDPFSKETRAELIARTEREHLSKSPFLATSVKKLVHLARQIQGKNLTEAIHQMRFSKKKAAREVLVQLQLARDTAIVQNGMGLGGGSSIQSATAKEGDELVPSGKKGGVKIQTKDGKFIEITDPTQMYVAEAWVNRGPWRGIAIDYRARGNSSRLMKPSTSELTIYTALTEPRPPSLAHPLFPISVTAKLTSLPPLTQASTSSSRRKRPVSVSTRSAWPASSAKDPGSTSPTVPSPPRDLTTPGKTKSATTNIVML